MKTHFKILLIISLLISTNNLFAATSTIFSRNYIGKLGNSTSVVFSLKNDNGKLSGFYYYEKIGVEIKLVGTLSNGIAVIYELDEGNTRQAKITARLSENNLSGKWESLASKKVFPLQLKTTNHAIPLLPNTLVGIYKVDEQDKCALSIQITKSKEGYFYHFKNQKRSLNGKVTFSRSLNENLVYIDFHGIEWEENSGDVSQDTDIESVSGNDILPTVVQGLLSDGEITIQNTGNAMNRYVKISNCDLKYIRLKRKHN